MGLMDHEAGRLYMLLGREEEEQWSRRAIELRGPQETGHDPEGWEARGWSWYLPVLAGMALPQSPLHFGGARALHGPCVTLAGSTQ